MLALTSIACDPDDDHADNLDFHNQSSEDDLDVLGPGNPRGIIPPDPGSVDGGKYYDTNANGLREPGEPGISGWKIHCVDANDVSTPIWTGNEGKFSVQLAPNKSYVCAEADAPGWMKAGNLVDQSWASGGCSVELSDDMTYTVNVVVAGETKGLWFGNVCIGEGGGHTPGFWQGPNGQELTDAAALTMLTDLNLVDADGLPFDPPDAPGLGKWLLSDATNMANKLSSHLAVSKLNTLAGFVDPNAMVYAPGTDAAEANGFASLAEVMAEANAELALHPLTEEPSAARSYQETLKNTLDKANNDVNFVQPSPASCPTPIFRSPA
jgi:hypothetical protein